MLWSGGYHYEKIIVMIFMLFVSLSFWGCTESIHSEGQPQTLTDSLHMNAWEDEWNSIKEDFEDVNQEIQIYSADGELLLTITDNEEIFIFTRNMEIDQWDYSVTIIPPDALKLCTIVDYMDHNGQMVMEAVESVYYDQNGYYHLSEAPDGGSQIKMTDGAARYIIELAGLELTGTQRFSDHDFSGLDGADDTGYITDSDELDAPFSDLTYEGMLKASAENLIEIHKDGVVVESISENQEVYEFLLSLNTSDWTSGDSILDSAVEVCTIVRYQLGRREFAGQMVEQSRLILYYDGVDYYMEHLITDDGSGHGNRVNELYPECFIVPAEIGERLSV